MPNEDIAILNPFNAMPAEQAIMVAVCGMVVVFLMLIILALVIRINSKLVMLLENKKEAAPAPAAKPAAAPAPAPAAPAVDEGELVAVMMAAIAEESGMAPNSFRITNISAAPAAAPVTVSAGETAVNSPMPGSIFKVECQVGQSVKAGDVLVVLEAMKMEIEVSAPVDGTVKAIAISVGTSVNTDDLLVTLG